MYVNWMKQLIFMQISVHRVVIQWHRYLQEKERQVITKKKKSLHNVLGILSIFYPGSDENILVRRKKNISKAVKHSLI